MSTFSFYVANLLIYATFKIFGFFGLTLILRSRDDLGGQFLHFSKCLAKGYDWVKFELSSYCASFRDTHTYIHTHTHTHTMTIPHSPDRRVRKNPLSLKKTEPLSIKAVNYNTIIAD